MMDTSEPKPTDSTSLPPVEVRRGAFAQLTIYEVAEYELDILAHGSPDSLYLNFAIFLLSVAISFLVGLLTAVLSSRVFTVFVVITTLGFVLGLLLLIIWLKKRSSTSDLVGKIRSRLPGEGIQEVNPENSL
ncbi:MAG: hypothetical protein ABJB61_02450 [bacterium]